jgi:hypothetical protein
VKKMIGVMCLLALATGLAFAAPNAQSNVRAFPKTLINAKYVYVTSYDGDAFNPNILPEDREAISNVQQAIQDWGHYILVYSPGKADMILAVQKRGSEDVLAVYDARSGNDPMYLWRVMGNGGLDKNEMPLFAELRQAVEQADNK